LINLPRTLPGERLPHKAVGRATGSRQGRRMLEKGVQCLLSGVKPISRSQWNDGFRPDSGPSRGDPCRRALRPERALKIGPMNGREARESGPSAKRVHPQAPGLPEDSYRMRRRILETALANGTRQAALPAHYRSPGRSDLPHLQLELTRRSFARIDTRRRALTCHRFAGGSNPRCGEAG
jgi:hypothetical protein